MKKQNVYLFKIVSLLIVVALVLAACGGGAKEEKPGSKDAAASSGGVIELNFNNFSSSTSAIAKNVVEPWKKLVEEKTNGKVKVNTYHGAALGGSTTVLKDVKGGVYEVGMLFSHYYQDSEIYPVTVGDLPFASTADVKTNTKIITQYFKKYQDSMLKDVISMGISSAAPSYLFSKKPVKTLEDMKGKKVRASGKSDVETIKQWGAVPVSVPLEEVYDALQKGIIDSVLTSSSQGRDLHLNEVAPYFTEMPYKVIQVLPIMNKAFFDKLPDDLKTLFKNELNPALINLITQANTNDSEAAIKDLTKLLQGKGEVIVLAPEELKRFQTSTKPSWTAWVDDANKKGYPGEQMMNEYKAILKQEGFELPF